jgi:hypothetical protein
MKVYSAVAYQKTKIKVFDTSTGNIACVINTNCKILNQPIVNNNVVSALCEISIGKVQNRVYKIPSGSLAKTMDI